MIVNCGQWILCHGVEQFPGNQNVWKDDRRGRWRSVDSEWMKHSEVPGYHSLSWPRIVAYTTIYKLYAASTMGRHSWRQPNHTRYIIASSNRMPRTNHHNGNNRIVYRMPNHSLCSLVQGQIEMHRPRRQARLMGLTTRRSQLSSLLLLPFLSLSFLTSHHRFIIHHHYSHPRLHLRCIYFRAGIVPACMRLFH